MITTTKRVNTKKTDNFCYQELANCRAEGLILYISILLIYQLFIGDITLLGET